MRHPLPPPPTWAPLLQPDSTTSQAAENKPAEFCCSVKRPTSKWASPQHQTVAGSKQCVLCYDKDLNLLKGTCELMMLSANVLLREVAQSDDFKWGLILGVSTMYFEVIVFNVLFLPFLNVENQSHVDPVGTIFQNNFGWQWMKRDK